MADFSSFLDGHFDMLALLGEGWGVGVHTEDPMHRRPPETQR